MTISLTHSPAWKALAAHHAKLAPVHMRDLFAQDPGRAGRFHFEFGELQVDYSKNRITAETVSLLLALARERGVAEWIRRMFAGEAINHTEGRRVLHVALRADQNAFPAVGSVMTEVRAARKRMFEFARAAQAGSIKGATGRPVTDVVNLGIGGSDAGPRMATRALRAHHTGRLRLHFAANIDPADLDAIVSVLDPERTFFIISSKSFGTLETLDNARRAREWLARSLGDRADPAAHFAAVTANERAARDLGVDPQRIFPIWDWVGGRFSVWSSVGLPVALAAGAGTFESFLEGARSVDAHFHTAPLQSNLPVLLALLEVWNVNFLGAAARAVIPYAEDLCEFPAWLQQLEMESNGKRVDREGREVDYATAPVVWGACGTRSQHSFHQLLHQGTQPVPVDFIVVGNGRGDERARESLTANALAQAAALMSGARHPDAPHRSSPGNRPSTTILLERLSPHALGQLLALYEHKVFVLGVIWNLNSFDQWGVEQGKELARALTGGGAAAADPSTRAMLERLRAR